MDRCFKVGELVRQSIESWESDKKVAIVASGGLSHWVPIPKIDSDKRRRSRTDPNFKKWPSRN